MLPRFLRDHLPLNGNRSISDYLEETNKKCNHGDYSSALGIIDRAIRQYPSFDILLYQKAGILINLAGEKVDHKGNVVFNTQRLQEAEKEIEKAISLNDKNFQYPLRKAEILTKAKKDTEALKVCMWLYNEGRRDCELLNTLMNLAIRLNLPENTYYTNIYNRICHDTNMCYRYFNELCNKDMNQKKKAREKIISLLKDQSCSYVDAIQACDDMSPCIIQGIVVVLQQIGNEVIDPLKGLLDDTVTGLKSGWLITQVLGHVSMENNREDVFESMKKIAQNDQNPVLMRFWALNSIKLWEEEKITSRAPIMDFK